MIKFDYKLLRNGRIVLLYLTVYNVSLTGIVNIYIYIYIYLL